MELFFDVIRFLVFGTVGLVVLLFILAILFGKRIKKKWEFEADFRDADGSEFGEFEIELSRIEKEEPDYTLKTKFRMRHAALKPHSTVQVYIEDTLVFEQMVEKEGRMFSYGNPPVNPPGEVSSGQVCRVMVGGTELASAELRPD